MSHNIIDGSVRERDTRLTHEPIHEIQPYGQIVRRPIALSEGACRQGVKNLNQLLVDTVTLRDLYKKHHWQVVGPTFFQLHLLFDKHYAEQNAFVDQSPSVFRYSAA